MHHHSLIGFKASSIFSLCSSMQFKYRAIDNMPQSSPPSSTTPYSPFSDQPLGGAGGFTRMFPPSTTTSAREALQREVEKELIRREIISGEMARRRELEEEVRRELALERELGIPMPERFLNTVAADVMPLPPQHCILDLAEIEEANNQDQLRANPNPDRYDAKRKAEVPAVNDSAHSRLMKIPKKDWRCALCGVSATDESGLNAHFRGRKHKAKEALGAENIGFDAKADIQTHQPCTAFGEGGMIQNNADTSAVEDKKEEQMVQKNQNISVSEINEIITEGAGRTNTLVKRKNEFWCDICGISTLSQVMLEDHKKGRKHRRRLVVIGMNQNNGSAPPTSSADMTMNQNNGSAPPTSSADNFSCSDEVPVAVSREDRVGEEL